MYPCTALACGSERRIFGTCTALRCVVCVSTVGAHHLVDELWQVLDLREPKDRAQLVEAISGSKTVI